MTTTAQCADGYTLGLTILAETIREREKYLRRGDVELLGAIALCHCLQGTLDFGAQGPMVGRLTDGAQQGEHVILQPWPGIPELLTITDEPCDQCAIPCPQCGDTGKQRCTSIRCGGSGKVVTSWKPCPECKIPVHDCVLCKGSGRVPAEAHHCPACEGAGVCTCSACLGTGQMATGKSDKNPEGRGPACPACHGGRRKLQSIPQPWEPYAVGVMEGYTVLGPVRGLLLRTLPGRDFPIDLTAELDYDGSYPWLLVEHPETTGGHMYVWGGRLRPVT